MLGTMLQLGFLLLYSEGSANQNGKGRKNGVLTKLYFKSVISDSDQRNVGVVS